MSGHYVNAIILDSNTSDPVLVKEGKIWYNSTDKKVKVYTDPLTREISFFEPGYGSIRASGAGPEANPVVCTDKNPWYLYDQFTANGLSKNTTNDFSNNRITIDTDGIWEVMYKATVRGDTGQKFDWGVRINGATLIQDTLSSITPTVSTTTYHNCVGHGFAAINATNWISLYVRCTSAAGQQIYGTYVTMTAKRMDDQ